MTDETDHVLIGKMFEALGKLSSQEFERLLDPKYGITIKVVRVKRSKEMSQAILDNDEMQNILARLNDCRQRDEAHEFLISHYPTKKYLQRIAQELEISVSKSDKVAELRERIVEATVGAKIRSKAIQKIDSK